MTDRRKKDSDPTPPRKRPPTAWIATKSMVGRVNRGVGDGERAERGAREPEKTANPAKQPPSARREEPDAVAPSSLPPPLPPPPPRLRDGHPAEPAPFDSEPPAGKPSKRTSLRGSRARISGAIIHAVRKAPPTPPPQPPRASASPKRRKLPPPIPREDDEPADDRRASKPPKR